MKNIIYSTAMVLALAAAPAQAGVSLSINIGLPPAPPLVAVSPGISVVEGFPEEVFFYGGVYWCRRPDGWYCARSPRERFGWVEAARVPRPLMRERVGYYRDWHPRGPRPEMRAGGPGWGRGPAGHGGRPGWGDERHGHPHDR